MKQHLRPWSTQEIQLLMTLRNEGKTDREISARLNRTFEAVKAKTKSLQLPAKERVEVMISPLSIPEAKDAAYWKHEYKELAKRFQKLQQEQDAVDQLVSDIKTLAPKSYEAAPPVEPPAKVHSGKPQSAVLMLSDTHIGAHVPPNQTLTFGHYDFSVFLSRLKFLEESVLSILQHHVTTEVPELVIPMLGDMLDGSLQHSNECGQLSPLFNQAFSGAHAMAQFLRNLSAHVPAIRIYDIVGNHTRYQNQKKMPTKNKHSNFDKFFYALVQAYVRDIPSIKWNLTAQPFAEFEVQGFQFFAGHGEILRGGDQAMKIPGHSVGRMISTTTQLYNKYDKRAPNYYLFGHLHRNISLPHATGDVIINGGFVGVDEFSLNEFFTPSDPMQKLFFVHETYGKTAVFDLGLKFAETNGTPPYVIPEEFPVA